MLYEVITLVAAADFVKDIHADDARAVIKRNRHDLHPVFQGMGVVRG